MAEPTPSAYPRRFSWPMRLFLGVMVFGMIVRCCLGPKLITLWADELNVAERPGGTPEEVATFFRPWPEAATRERLTDGPGCGRFVIVWVYTRLEYLGVVVGFPQGWPMFSGAHTSSRVCRARLLYADGRAEVVRLRSDPEDLTRYSRWNFDKVQNYEVELKEKKGYTAELLGYCNMLSHRHATNEAGSALKTIRLFWVRHDFPPPGADAREWLREQTRRPACIGRDAFTYDVTTRHGRWLAVPKR